MQCTVKPLLDANRDKKHLPQGVKTSTERTFAEALLYIGFGF
jgi:hypothetical protein